MTDQKVIKYASKAAYQGNVGSGSVNGYWTIWAQRVVWDEGQWRERGQAWPVRINMTIDDLRKYCARWPLFLIPGEFIEEITPAKPMSCSHCGGEWMAPVNSVDNDGLCVTCRTWGMMDIGGEK